MSELEKFGKKVAKVTSIILLFAFLISLMNNYMDVAYGIIIGGAFSLLKLKINIDNLEQFAEMASGARNFMVKKNFSRYGIAAICIGLGFYVQQINPWATVIAYFSTNLVIIILAGVEGSKPTLETD